MGGQNIKKLYFDTHHITGFGYVVDTFLHKHECGPSTQV